MKKSVLALAFLVLSSSMLAPLGAQAAPTQPLTYNRISLQAQVWKKVDHDEVHASLFAEAMHRNPVQLANELNARMAKAQEILKKYPKVVAKIGHYNTHRIYKDPQNRWKATQVLSLQGKVKDLKDFSILLGELQGKGLLMRSVNFSVSKKLRDKVETSLINEALDAFKKRALIVQKKFKAKDHVLVKLSVNTSGHHPPQPRYYRQMEMAATSKSASAPVLKAGETQLSVSISGSIELNH